MKTLREHVEAWAAEKVADRGSVSFMRMSQEDAYIEGRIDGWRAALEAAKARASKVYVGHKTLRKYVSLHDLDALLEELNDGK